MVRGESTLDFRCLVTLADGLPPLQESVKNQGQLRSGPSDLFWDDVFANEINEAIVLAEEAYDK